MMICFKRYPFLDLPNNVKFFIFNRERTVLFLQNNTIWEKLHKGCLTYDEFESFVYTKEYLSVSNPAQLNDVKMMYNQGFKKYFFEPEEYDSEEDYEEVFYQRFLNGEIHYDQYIYFEKKFLDMLNALTGTGKTFVFYSVFTDNLQENFPFKQCSDLEIDKAFIEKNQNCFLQIRNRKEFEQISVLSAREIISTDFIFPDIKSVFLNSGLHGILLSEGMLPDKIKNTFHFVSDRFD